MLVGMHFYAMMNIVFFIGESPVTYGGIRFAFNGVQFGGEIKADGRLWKFN